MAPKILVYIFLAFCPFIIVAQTTLKGKISEAETSTPIAGAHIVTKGELKGVTSDSSGIFEINVISLPVTLEITHISYKTKELIIKDTEFQKITLNLNTTLLNPFSVTANFKENISGGKSFLVIDYEFAKNGILQLCRNLSSGEYLIRHTSYNGDLRFESSLNQRPDKLCKDCEGFIYLVYKNSVQELKIKENLFTLESTYSQKEFNAINRCIIELKDKYYFNVLSGNKQKLAYFYINKEEKSNLVKIKEIEDEMKQLMWKDELRFRNMPGPEFNEFDEIFSSLFIYSPVYAPLIKVKDGYCIFDFVNGRIDHFSSDNKITKTVPIHFHKEKGWKKQLFYDDKTNKIYQLFEINGTEIIREIDINSGNLINHIELKGFSFAENIKVHDNYIYFIGRNPENNQLKQIFRNKFN